MTHKDLFLISAAPVCDSLPQIGLFNGKLQPGKQRLFAVPAAGRIKYRAQILLRVKILRQNAFRD